MEQIIEKIFEFSSFLETNYIKPYIGKIQSLALCVAAVLAVIFLLAWIICGCKRHKWKVKYRRTKDQLTYVNDTLTKAKVGYETESADNVELKATNKNLSIELAGAQSELNDLEHKYAEVVAKNKELSDASEKFGAEKAALIEKIASYDEMSSKYEAFVAAEQRRKLKAAKAKKVAEAEAIKKQLKEYEDLKKKYSELKAKKSDATIKKN